MPIEQYSFERYLNVRSAYVPSFSHDGKRLSFLTNITGVAEVWSVPIDIHATAPAWPDQLTFRGERVAGASYSPVADVLLVSADVGGNERDQLYLLSADGAAFTALTSQPETIHRFGGWSLDGHYALMSRWYSNVNNQLFMLDTITGETRVLTPEMKDWHAIYAMPAWSANMDGLYLLSNLERQFLSLAWLDLATAEMTYLRDDLWDVDSLALTRDGTHMALVFNEDGYSRLLLFDVSKGWDARVEIRRATVVNSHLH